MEQRSGNRFQGLEGIRAYAFLAVFIVHYTTNLYGFSHFHKFLLVVYPIVFLAQFSWIAVPVFFVLSGFLITGVLYDTRDRQGFFKVFYGRRAIRILPLYYTAIAVTALLALAAHLELHLRDLSYLVYLHNFFLHGPQYNYWPYFSLMHLWSLAVEEQFYLVWPLVIWLLRKREWLLWFSYGVIIAVSMLRICWPLTKMPLEYTYFSTFTRCDALMLGAALALHKRKAGFDLEVLAGPAKVVLCAGVLLFIAKMLLTGNALPYDYFGVAVLMPTVSFISGALVLLALLPGNPIYRSCNRPWAVAMGAQTYSLYVIHFIALPFFSMYLLEVLKARMGTIAAHGFTIALAIASTFILSFLSFRYIEVPGMEWKRRLPYGAQIEVKTEPLIRLVTWIKNKWAFLGSGPAEPIEEVETGL